MKNSENHKEMQTESSTGLWPESSQTVSQWGREIAEKHTRGRISVLNVNIISYFNNEYLLLLIWHILCTLLDSTWVKNEWKGGCYQENLIRILNLKYLINIRVKLVSLRYLLKHKKLSKKADQNRWQGNKRHPLSWYLVSYPC